MAIRYILSEYLDQAMAQAVYDKLDDGTFAGRIPSCKGVLVHNQATFLGMTRCASCSQP